MILILYHASLFHASSSKPTLKQALDEAYSQYVASDIHNEINAQFTVHSYNYSVLHITEFILQHHFWFLLDASYYLLYPFFFSLHFWLPQGAEPHVALSVLHVFYIYAFINLYNGTLSL